MAPASDNYYIDPEPEDGDAPDSINGGSIRTSSVIFIPQSDEARVDPTSAESSEPATQSGDGLKSYAEPMEITIGMVSLLLQALIMYAVKNESNLNVDTDALGNGFDNYTRRVMDSVLPSPVVAADPPLFQRPGLTIPFDDGLPRTHHHGRPRVNLEEGCGYENTIPIMSEEWSPVRVVVCEHFGEASVQINEWIDKLPYDGVILSPHEFYALEYLHDSILEELIFLDRMAREGGLEAGCVLPVPIHRV